MDPSLIAKIARRFVKKLLMRPSLVEIESFSRKRFTVGRSFGLKQTDATEAPMILVTPKYLVKESSPDRDLVTVSVEVTLNRKHAQFLADPALAAEVAAYLDEAASERTAAKS